MDTLQSREAKWLTSDPKAFEMAETESLLLPLFISPTMFAEEDHLCTEATSFLMGGTSSGSHGCLLCRG